MNTSANCTILQKLLMHSVVPFSLATILVFFISIYLKNGSLSYEVLQTMCSLRLTLKDTQIGWRKRFFSTIQIHASYKNGNYCSEYVSYEWNNKRNFELSCNLLYVPHPFQIRFIVFCCLCPWYLHHFNRTVENNNRTWYFFLWSVLAVIIFSDQKNLYSCLVDFCRDR